MKKVSFDMMNLGRPVHTDPFEVENIPSEISLRMAFESERHIPNYLLREKLMEEVNKMHSDFLLRNPSSSDESDDCAFPETINEQVRRQSFAKRRKLHYTEFATVDLARRLVCEEFATETSSVKSEDSTFRSLRPEEECQPCWTQSTESFPFLQYERPTGASQVSDESAVKEDPEPGFDPTHPCYKKLVGNQSPPMTPKQTPTELPTAAPSITGFYLPIKPPTEISKDLQDSLERHTRVVDKGEKWNLQHSHPHTQEEISMDRSSKGSRGHANTRAGKPGKPVGFRSL